MKIRHIDDLKNVRTDGRLAKWDEAAPLATTLVDGLVSEVVNEWEQPPVYFPLNIITGNTRAAMSVYGANWASVRSSTESSVSTTNLYYNASKANASTFGIVRLVFNIDSLSGQQITSGSITLSKAASAIDSDSAYLYGFTRDVAGTTSSTDFDNFGIKLSALATYDTANEAITFVLNTDGLAYVNAGNVSFMVRDWEDADNVTPTLVQNSFQSFNSFTTTFYNIPVSTKLVQSTDVNRFQFGFDSVGNYDVSTLADGLVLAFSNSVTNTRKLPNLSGVSGTAPTKSGGYLDYSFNKILNISNISQTLKCLTVEFFGKMIDITGAISNVSYCHLINTRTTGSASGTYLVLTKGSSGYFQFWFFGGNGTNSVTLTSPSYTESEIIALFGTNDTHIFGRFIAGKYELIINNNIVASTQSASVTSIVINSVTDLYTRNQLAGTTLKVKYTRVYYSYLNDNEISLLYENRNNSIYTLQKKGLQSSGSSYLTVNILPPDTVITAFTVTCWINLQNVLDYNASFPDQQIISEQSFIGTGYSGFQFKIQRNSNGEAYFRFICGNNVTVTPLNADVLTLSAFRTKYLKKYTGLTTTVLNTGTTDIIIIYINGHYISRTTVVSGSFKTSPSGIVNLGQRASVNDNFGAGNRIYLPRLRLVALSADEVLREYQDDKIKYNFY